MSRQGTDISHITVKKRLNEQSLYKLKSLLKLLLLDIHRDNRLEWAKKNKKID